MFALIAPVHQCKHTVIACRDISHIVHVIFHITFAHPCCNVELTRRRFCQQYSRFEELVVIHEPGEESLNAHHTFFVIKKTF